MKKSNRLTIKELKWISAIKKKAKEDNQIAVFILDKKGKMSECYLYSYGGYLIKTLQY